MKKLITNYTFDASAKQVVFTDYNPVSLAGIILITNTTDNIIIYSFDDPLLGGTVATATLTLTYDTGSMSDTDKLQIWYDDGVGTVGVTGTVDLGATDNAVLDTIDSVLDTVNAKLVNGTDIGDVTVNNSTGAAAVNIQDGGNTITVDGTVAVTNAGITTIAGAVTGTEMQVDVLTMPSTAVTNSDITSCKTALELIDNSVDGNYLNVNMNLAGTDCPSGNGTAATSQRVTIASDSTGQIKLAAGTDGIGKLTSNSGVDIGDVDILSIAAGDNNIGNVDIVTMPGIYVEDAGETAGGNLMMAGSVRRDTAASSAGTTGDNATLNTDANGGLYVAHNITTIGHGVKTVTTAGTDVALAASTACKKVDIQAMNDNTGVIAVGGSGVDATPNSGSGVILYAGDIYCLEIDNLADVYVDATVSGNKVRFTYYS